ncbi:MAG: hypothetical protein F6J93_05585 [Oscillatoria sp. SIO1A7]|nr:hypothetical protein [Oscillatoria sp. SIO1A7]
MDKTHLRFQTYSLSQACRGPDGRIDRTLVQWLFNLRRKQFDTANRFDVENELDNNGDKALRAWEDFRAEMTQRVLIFAERLAVAKANPENDRLLSDYQEIAAIAPYAYPEQLPDEVLLFLGRDIDLSLPRPPDINEGMARRMSAIAALYGRSDSDGESAAISKKSNGQQLNSDSSPAEIAGASLPAEVIPNPTSGRQSDRPLKPIGTSPASQELEAAHQKKSAKASSKRKLAPDRGLEVSTPESGARDLVGKPTKANPVARDSQPSRREQQPEKLDISAKSSDNSQKKKNSSARLGNAESCLAPIARDRQNAESSLAPIARSELEQLRSLVSREERPLKGFSLIKRPESIPEQGESDRAENPLAYRVFSGATSLEEPTEEYGDPRQNLARLAKIVSSLKRSPASLSPAKTNEFGDELDPREDYPTQYLTKKQILEQEGELFNRQLDDPRSAKKAEVRLMWQQFYADREWVNLPPTQQNQPDWAKIQRLWSDPGLREGLLRAIATHPQWGLQVTASGVEELEF